MAIWNGGRTVDGVDDLAVGGAGAALLDFCVVELEELVDPSEQVCARDGSHGCRNKKNSESGELERVEPRHFFG